MENKQDIPRDLIIKRAENGYLIHEWFPGHMMGHDGRFHVATDFMELVEVLRDIVDPPSKESRYAGKIKFQQVKPFHMLGCQCNECGLSQDACSDGQPDCRCLCRKCQLNFINACLKGAKQPQVHPDCTCWPETLKMGTYLDPKAPAQSDPGEDLPLQATEKTPDPRVRDPHVPRGTVTDKYSL